MPSNSQTFLIEKDWFGKPIKQASEFWLDINGSKLYFAAKAYCKPNIMPNLDPLTFVEGLWEFDLAELFISLSSSSYLELNLAASGNWWLARFSEYRKRELAYANIQAQTRSVISPESWFAELEIDLADAGIAAAVSPLKLNFNMIFGQNKRTYLSYHLPAPGKPIDPDFHLAELRRTLY